MKCMIVIRSYFKKSRLQIAVISLLLLLASVIMGISLILGLDYKQNYKRTHDRLNAEHIVLMFADTDDNSKLLSEKLDGNPEISEYEINDVIVENGSCRYGDDGMLISNFSFISYTEAAGKKIGQYEIIDECDAGEIYIPYIFKANGFYNTGDIFTVNLGSGERGFIIKGFYNNMTSGTANCRDVSLILTDDKYTEYKSQSGLNRYKLSVRLVNADNAERLEPQLISELSGAASTLVFLDGTNWIKLSASRYISETIFVGIMTAAAIVIIIVLLSIVAVTLSNYIKENMRNLGIMKAVGYVSPNLLAPIISALSVLSIIMSFAGYLLSYLLLPLINKILESQSGVVYGIRFLFIPMLITVGLCVFLIFATALLSMMKIRSILPIAAIRPQRSKSAGSAVLPLEKTKLGLSLAIGMKNIFSDVRKYVIFFVASCLITAMLCVAAFCSETILKNGESVFRLIFGNTADVSVTVPALNEQEFKTYINGCDSVTSSVLITMSTVCHEGGGRITAIVRDEEGIKQADYLLWNGELPDDDESLALNYVYAEKYGLCIGDEMELTIDGKSLTYNICGLIQDASCSGISLIITREGFERLSTLRVLTYGLTLKDGIDTDDFIAKLKSAQPGTVSVNYREYIDGMSESYISMLNALTVVIIILSMAVSVLVLAVIVNMILFNKRREHGILKSLGFVTPQIVFQTAISFVPIAILGSVLGLAISHRGISALFSCFIRNIGIISLGGSISPSGLIGCGLLFTSFTFGITCLLSAKVRRTVPHDLFNNE